MTDGHDDIATEGREAVRLHFVQRLAAAGLIRPKGMAASAYDEMLKGLVAWLAYMRPENLMTLAEVVIDNAAGGRCPSEVVIKQFAGGLQEKPPTENRIFTSWLASIEGPSAILRGDLVELFRFLRSHNRPPSAYDKRKIADASEENQRTRALIAGRIERDTATPEDRAWMAAYLADQRMANDIVAAGEDRRAAKSSGEAA